ncbi:hypothetical protein ACVIHF_000529 [Bradyrhizobium sp. USDA 4506]
MIEPGSLTSEGTGQPGFAGTGLSGDDEVLMSFELGALRRLQGITPIKPASSCEVDIFDTGVDEAQLCFGQAIGQAFVGTRSGFAIEHQAKPGQATPPG